MDRCYQAHYAAARLYIWSETKIFDFIELTKLYHVQYAWLCVVNQLYYNLVRMMSR